MARLELVGIELRYGTEHVLRNVSLEVEDGELLAIVGPSGCGKTSLLRIVAGLVAPTAGKILLDGERIDEREPAARDVAMVFQNYALYPHMSVRKNLAFPLEMARVARAEVERRVQSTAELLGLRELLERKPGALSGGQMQRVAVGRAIIRNPRLFLFDEPLSNLDAKLRDEMRTEIRALHERLGITTLYVTHDQAEAMTMGSRVCVLDRGRVLQIGAPLDVFARPRTSFVAAFLGSPPMNLLAGRASGGRFECGALSVAAPVAEARELVLGIRPHEVEIGGPHEGTVTWVEELGTRTLVECDLGGARVRVVREGALAIARGERMHLALPAARLHWFDARTSERL
jgi:ABC-type sugar transport system ATPase subunit